MPEAEKAISEIRKYFVTWVTEISLAGATDFFDINRVSENTSQHLLNLIFGYSLIDLNQEKKNFPGLDLGDSAVGIAFQITSRKDTAKVTGSLKTFKDYHYLEKFPNGIRFFIINNGKRPAIKSDIIREYLPSFDSRKHIYFPADLLELIAAIYYKDKTRFQTIRDFLIQEFGVNKANQSIINLGSGDEKLNFYRKLFTANYQNASLRFVPFACKINDEDILTEELPKYLFGGKGGLILGPSGCGKSILSRKLALKFLEDGIPILILAKYYETDFNTLFDKEMRAYGFESGSAFFSVCRAKQISVLVIVDGLNECKADLQAKLLLELELVIANLGVTALITAQHNDALIEDLGLTQAIVSYPEHELKKAIAASYSGKKTNVKLDPILKVVSSSLEAQMIGEIGSEEIDKVSHFSLFAIFIKNKLGKLHVNGFLFLSLIAKQLSDKITFNISDRSLNNILKLNHLSEELVDHCISAALLERQVGKVSFTHEMFFNFFVADSIVRFAADAETIVKALNSPKNSDKKLLIIGSIEDTTDLHSVLETLTDVELLIALFNGGGGSYSQAWLKQQISKLLVDIENEISNLKFEFGDENLTGIQFEHSTFWPWTQQQFALIHLLPSLLVRDNFFQEVFSLIGVMDDHCSVAKKEMQQAAHEKGFSAKTSIFSTTYIGVGQKGAAMTRLFSTLHSGFATFRQAVEISDDTIAGCLKNKSLKHGQFFFLLLILRYSDQLQTLYPYVKSLLKNWRAVPYHLLSEVLQQIGFCCNSDAQRAELTELLNAIHSETENIWLSTNLFDALGSLGALQLDAEEYEATVSLEIALAMENPDQSESWDMAANIYYKQFDHPYDTAYYNVIHQLSEPICKMFFLMALKGHYSSFFTSALLKESWRLLGPDIAPVIMRWTEDPIIEQTAPQDSLGVFLITHILLGKSDFELPSRYASAAEKKDQSLFAGAELYYWLNRTTKNADKINITKAAKTLFDSTNQYAISTVYQLRHCLNQSDFHQRIDDENMVVTIESAFVTELIGQCRHALQNLDFNEDIFRFSRSNDEVNLHAIYLLEKYGCIVDLDVLRPLSEHALYGEAAVRAIKALSNY